MSSSGKAGNGRGNNRKRQHRRRDNDGDRRQKDVPGQGSGVSYRADASHGGDAPNRGFSKRNSESIRGDRLSFIERPKWIPPRMNTEPLPVSVCPWCGKPIRDMSTAIADKDTGVPVHFDCVTSRIAFGEKLDKGESVAYIGGGRFGIVSFSGSASIPRSFPVESHSRENAEAGEPKNRQDRSSTSFSHDFTIKKIIEWESKEKRAEWRSVICEHYSVM